MKTFKKTLSALAALCLTVSLCLTTAGAAGSSTFCYDQLDSRAQEVYRLLLANLPSLRTGKTITYEKAGLTEREAKEYLKAGREAWLALGRDHSEIFWVYGLGIRSIGHFSSAGQEESWYEFELEPELGAHWKTYPGGEGRSLAADEGAMEDGLDKVVRIARAAGDTAYAQLLAAHDWLTENNCYNLAAVGNSTTTYIMPWTPLSALDIGLSPVCEGYARAFQLICGELGVPCILVSGENHMWNYVQMEDGKWYLVDVTYDDPNLSGVTRLTSGVESHEYFLIGTSRNHSPDRDWAYPQLSGKDYDPDNAVPFTAITSETTAPEVTTPEVTTPEVTTPEVTTPEVTTPEVTPEPAVSFYDVPPGAYYAAPVAWAVEHKITSGTGEGAFSPDRTCTTEQILTFIWNAYGSRESTVANPFRDVSGENYYYRAVLWAYELGLISGSLFGAGAPCTRAMAVTCLWKAAGSPESSQKLTFLDLPQDGVTPQAVAWAVEQGITAGTGVLTFSPDRTCTRAEIMTFLYNAVA